MSGILLSSVNGLITSICSFPKQISTFVNFFHTCSQHSCSCNFSVVATVGHLQLPSCQNFQFFSLSIIIMRTVRRILFHLSPCTVNDFIIRYSETQLIIQKRLPLKCTCCMSRTAQPIIFLLHRSIQCYHRHSYAAFLVLLYLHLSYTYIY